MIAATSAAKGLPEEPPDARLISSCRRIGVTKVWKAVDRDGHLRALWFIDDDASAPQKRAFERSGTQLRELNDGTPIPRLLAARATAENTLVTDLR